MAIYQLMVDIFKFPKFLHLGLLMALGAGIIDIIALRKDSEDVEALIDKALESREDEEEDD